MFWRKKIVVWQIISWHCIQIQLIGMMLESNTYKNGFGMVASHDFVKKILSLI